MKLMRNNKGQGMTEYIVILGIIVAVAVTILMPQIKAALNTKLTAIASSINS